MCVMYSLYVLLSSFFVCVAHIWFKHFNLNCSVHNKHQNVIFPYQEHDWLPACITWKSMNKLVYVIYSAHLIQSLLVLMIGLY